MPTKSALSCAQDTLREAGALANRARRKPWHIPRGTASDKKVGSLSRRHLGKPRGSPSPSFRSPTVPGVGKSTLAIFLSRLEGSERARGYIHGAGLAFDPEPNHRWKTFEKSDHWALLSDWLAIGEDLRCTLERAAEETRTPSRSARSAGPAKNGDNLPEPSEPKSSHEEPVSEEPVPTELAAVLQRRGVNLRDPSVRQAVMVTVGVTRLTQGPIPSAQVLAEYDDVRPGIADQIIGWADAQIKHRMNRENYASERTEQRLDRSQRNAFLLSLIALALAAVLTYLGSGWWVPTVITVVGVGGPSAATLLSRLIKPPR